MKTVRDALMPHGVTVRVFFMDEARFGQQGTLTRVWAPKGSRPTAVNTATMSVYLGMVSAELGPKEHAVLIMDGAGWHKSRKLAVPENITVLILPPYSPELNPVERLWAYLRSHYLANRVYDDYQHLLDAGARAWQQLTPQILSSVCACDYITHEVES